VKFNDEWPTLEKWFDPFSVLKHVDAAAGNDEVADVVDGIIQQCLVKDTPQVDTHVHTESGLDHRQYSLHLPGSDGQAELAWVVD